MLPSFLIVTSSFNSASRPAFERSGIMPKGCPGILAAVDLRNSMFQTRDAMHT
jgi:hypothetical protein